MTNKQSYVASTFDSAGSLVLKTTAKLNENFRVILMEETYYSGKDPTKPTDDNIVEYSFDPGNHLVKVASKDKLTKRRYIELEVVNMAFDSRGNAIKTLKKSLSGKKRLVFSRWEYFD